MKKFGICLSLTLSVFLMFVSCGDEKIEDPAKFYKKIVESEITDLKSGLKTSYNLSKLKMKCSATLNIHDSGKEYVSAFLDGMDMSWLNTIKLGLDYSFTGEKLAMNIDAGVNKGNISLNAYMDDDFFAMRIPELNKKYLGISIDELNIFDGLDYKAFFNDYLSYLAIFSDAKRISGIVDKFKDTYLKYVKTVDFENDGILTVNGISQKCKVLTVELRDADLKDFVSEVLSQFLQDEYIKDALSDLDSMYKELGMNDIYRNLMYAADELINSLEYEDFEGTGIRMVLYVDSGDEVCGRTILIDEGYSSPEEILSYKLAKEKSKYALDVSVMDEIEFQSEGTVSANSYTGECKILDKNGEGISFNVEKFKIDSRKNQVTGKIIYAPTDGTLPRGMAVAIDLSGKTSVVISVLENEKSIADLKIEAKLASGSSISTPKDVEMINLNSQTEVMEYVAEMNFENLKKVVSAVGMPKELTDTANSLIDYYLLMANLN